MPYLPYPDGWPVFAANDKIGDWPQMYPRVMALNYWSSTLCKSASYDEASAAWTVTVEREGKELVLTSKQLIMASGMSAVPKVAEFAAPRP